jgi:hypothetical protein
MGRPQDGVLKRSKSAYGKPSSTGSSGRWSAGVLPQRSQPPSSGAGVRGNSSMGRPRDGVLERSVHDLASTLSAHVLGAGGAKELAHGRATPRRGLGAVSSGKALPQRSQPTSSGARVRGESPMGRPRDGVLERSKSAYGKPSSTGSSGRWPATLLAPVSGAGVRGNSPMGRPRDGVLERSKSARGNPPAPALQAGAQRAFSAPALQAGGRMRQDVVRS